MFVSYVKESASGACAEELLQLAIVNKVVSEPDHAPRFKATVNFNG